MYIYICIYINIYNSIMVFKLYQQKLVQGNEKKHRNANKFQQKVLLNLLSTLTL